MYVLLLFTQADTLPFDVRAAVEFFSQDSTGSDPEDNIPLIMLRSISNTGESSTKKGKIAENEPNWTDEIIIDITMNQGNGYLAREDIVKQELAVLNPFQIVEKLFDDEIITYITKETQRYAAQQNNHSFTVTNNEIKIFIGFLLFTGYHRLQREKLYWCTDEDLNIPLVRGSMSRNKYYEIKKYFHLANNETVDDKLSIDEAMVKYFKTIYPWKASAFRL
ncbi:transposase is4 [Holotrichia oblita]|uniref:Transposase is4 n=1 Tax=Holotrichia oblita TaxID=644536 RepID=A0ACB9TRC8_HOLOL|nr:transposase is4 [Holotrichia oblita]